MGPAERREAVCRVWVWADVFGTRQEYGVVREESAEVTSREKSLN